MREYLQLFQDSSDIWEEESGGANWMYERAVYTVFNVALAELSDGGRRLIYVLASLNPDGVQERILFPNMEEDQINYLK